MKRCFTRLVFAASFAMLCTASSAQNSLLLNFGSNSCTPGSFNNPGFTIIKNPLTGNPEILSDCNMQPQLNNFFAVFIAYNPKNNKVYVADVKSFAETKIWVLDIGLPGNITCPASIPVTPTYTYGYVSNNFEFDNNGDLWSISDYNYETGSCNLDKFDVNTGAVINTRTLQFPEGNFPTSVYSGDITIIPNGRMFVTLGDSPSRLYEVKNYTGTNTAVAEYLATLPKDCFGISYLNGALQVTGQNLSASCYYYEYDIAAGTLSEEKVFQNGQSPIDNSSFTPTVGTGKSLVGSTVVNENTADLTYHVYVENIGNVTLNNINVTEDLEAAFGAGNVTNVAVSFIPAFNNGGLLLNPDYDGALHKQLLLPAQNLPNNTAANQDYFFKIQVQCRVTNLVKGVTYYNSAIASANIGDGTLAQLNIADSSLNGGGDTQVVDPNQNAVADEPEENIPTPYTFTGPLPVRFLQVQATLTNKVTAVIDWRVATPVINAADFEVQYSTDGINWKKAGHLLITNNNKGSYTFTHNNIPGATKLYYRIKQTDKDGQFIYSRVVLLTVGNSPNHIVVFPNPAAGYLSVSMPAVNAITVAELYDAVGRKLHSQRISASTTDINTMHFPNGTYLLRLIYGAEQYIQKVVIRH
ncbi:MAG TPA: T9SS type A sorting domain-containing protein [Ferruginibacter sp.]|nr:T9SS type A sorting domain-containing protein [Ferruginibacter sp.]HMP22284.1 T9SS type A sorting domain-containing protein [Ferruginibacter sp.]